MQQMRQESEDLDCRASRNGGARYHYRNDNPYNRNGGNDLAKATRSGTRVDDNDNDNNKRDRLCLRRRFSKMLD